MADRHSRCAQAALLLALAPACTAVGGRARDADSEAGTAAEVAADVVASSPPPPLHDGAEWLLSQTGLYADIATQTLNTGVLEFSPRYPLWADGARKRRFIALSPGRQIDTADMDHWQFPVGTRVWKEFSRDGLRLETRLIIRIGPGDMDYWMAAFVWDAGGGEARLTPPGAANVAATDHDVPAAKTCWSCHQGEPGRLLGFSAIQLAAGTPGLAALIDRGLLSAPPGQSSVPDDLALNFGPPGAPLIREVLGTLHANCGSCHNPNGIARPDTNLNLRLLVAERDPRTTALYTSTVGIEVQKFKTAEAPLRIDPGRPDSSAILVRMRTRDRARQMPPLANKHVDTAAVDIVTDWIAGL